MKSFKFLIEHHCPQCGAPATLEETDHLFRCEFCRVKSALLTRAFRYMLPHTAQGEKEIIFFPYWRFKGMLFSCVPSGINYRIVDVSHQAIESRCFPDSVGLRSQTMKLRFVTSETEGLFLKPNIPFEGIGRIIEHRFNMFLPKPIFHQTYVGETISQIYSPFYVDGGVYDAVLNEPVSSERPDDFDISDTEEVAPEWDIRFIPALCPKCGWDLDGERDSLILHCQNCNSAWYPARDQFKGINFAHIPDNHDDLTYLPFYRIGADVTGITLDSYADLVRLANLPKVVQANWKDREFHFWSPAFKIRPQDFLQLAQHVTLAQPQGELVHGLPEAKVYPATLPLMEAVESSKINLASFMKPQRSLFPRLKEIKITPQRIMLVYIPFYNRGNELSYPDFNLRINNNLLGFARYL